MASAAVNNSNGGSPALFRFRRNDHHLEGLLDTFRQLRDDDQLLDCSLVCQGKVLRAHKLLLAASSEYFRSAFASLSASCQSTAVIIKDMSFDDLKIIVDFIYKGEITVEQLQVPSLIKSAEALQIAGLCYTETSPSSSAGSTRASVGSALVSALAPNSSAFNLRKILPGHLPIPNHHQRPSSAELSQQKQQQQQQQHQQHYHSVALPSIAHHHYQQQQQQQHQQQAQRDCEESSGPLGSSSTPQACLPRRDSSKESVLSSSQQLVKREARSPFIQSNDDDGFSSSDGEIEMPSSQHHQQHDQQDPKSVDNHSHDGDDGGQEKYEVRSASQISAEEEAGLGYRVVIEEGEEEENSGLTTRAEIDKVIDLSSSGSSVSDTYEHKKLKIALKSLHKSKAAAAAVVRASSNSNAQHKSLNGINSALRVVDNAGNAVHFATGSEGPLYTSTSSAVIGDQLSSTMAVAAAAAANRQLNQTAFPRNLERDPAARAIAASTTLAVMSNILSSQSANQQFSDDTSLSEHYSQFLLADSNFYKVRPILPAVPGLIHSGSQVGHQPHRSLVMSSSSPVSEHHRNHHHGQQGHHQIHQMKRARVVGEPYPARGRKPKPVPPSREVNGKNKCPHCPQVYYSTQAMNDHVNNVHSMNAQKYVCSICAKEFSWKISLNKHMRKLHNEEPLDTKSSVQSAPSANANYVLPV